MANARLPNRPGFALPHGISRGKHMTDRRDMRQERLLTFLRTESPDPRSWIKAGDLWELESSCLIFCLAHGLVWALSGGGGKSPNIACRWRREFPEIAFAFLKGSGDPKISQIKKGLLSVTQRGAQQRGA